MKTIVFDFDGVIHKYSQGWQGVDNVYDEPVDGMLTAIRDLSKEYKIAVVSSRCAYRKGMRAVRAWLKEHGFTKYITGVYKEKPPAIVYIDDRAICFDGKPENLLVQIQKFKTWQGV